VAERRALVRAETIAKSRPSTRIQDAAADVLTAHVTIRRDRPACARTKGRPDSRIVEHGAIARQLQIDELNTSIILLPSTASAALRV